MALIGSIMMGVYKTPVGAGGVLKVIQGGNSTISTYENKWDTYSPYSVKAGFVWDGNMYLPSGSWRANTTGYLSYNPSLVAMEFQTNNYCTARYIPVGKYLAGCDGTNWYRYTSPQRADTQYWAVGAIPTPYDYVVNGNMVHMTTGAASSYVMQYPFTTSGVAIPGVVDRLCTYNGEVYGFDVVVGPGSCRLKKYVSGTWQNVGAGWTPTQGAHIQYNYPTQTCFFSYNGMLWVIFCYNNAAGAPVATQWVRAYSIDPTTGVATEDTINVPAAWLAAPVNTYSMLFEVIDDSQATRQVFIVRCGDFNAGLWEMYEFSDIAPWLLVSSGVDIINPLCGIVWGDASKGSLIESVIDSVPSEYVTAVIRTSDLPANGLVDIDPRYNDLVSPSQAPYLACTERLGGSSEGKVNLSSAPAGIAALGDLSDDFADGVIDPDLWEVCQPAYNEAVNGYDYGLGAFSAGTAWYNILETSSRIAFGGTVPLPPSFLANTGIGIVSKWNMTGDFQVDVMIAGIANIATSATRAYRIFLKIFESANHCFGIQISNNAGTYSATGFTFVKNTLSAAGNISADFATLEGNVIRISRTAGVWAMVHDPAGAADDLMPAIVPVSTDPVRILLGACCRVGANWTTATPGPGFSDIVVSGAGALGLYVGSVTHIFEWDHETDLGAGYNGTAQMYVDS